jgi:hypothetical protein
MDLPGNSSKSIFVMNVHPSYGENPRGPTTATPFAPEALYELKIDTDGDAIADITYRVRFSLSQSGTQTATLRRAEGTQATAASDKGEMIVGRASVSAGLEARITEAGDYRFFAGWRSDPFFFDRRGAINNLQFTGDDFFADKNVCSMVLEVPNSALPPKAIGLWHGTLLRSNGSGKGWMQVERGARPLQLFVVLGLSREESRAYLTGEPANDARFIPAFAHALEHTGGYPPEHAVRIARTMLPEMLPYDPKRLASFPVNGRTLTDDTVDSFLALLTNGRVTGDGVGAHRDLLSEFPYLGLPHNI